MKAHRQAPTLYPVIYLGFRLRLLAEMCLRARTLLRVAAADTQSETGWARWLREQLRERDWQPIEITRRTGIASSQTSRWLDSPRVPDVPSIKKVCRAFDVPVVTGLLAAGVLDRSDIDGVVVEVVDLSRVSGRALADEVAERLLRAEHVDHGGSGEHPTVTPMRPVPVIHPEGRRGTDWAARPKPE